MRAGVCETRWLVAMHFVVSDARGAGKRAFDMLADHSAAPVRTLRGARDMASNPGRSAPPSQGFYDSPESL